MQLGEQLVKSTSGAETNKYERITFCEKRR